MSIAVPAFLRQRPVRVFRSLAAVLLCVAGGVYATTIAMDQRPQQFQRAGGQLRGLHLLGPASTAAGVNKQVGELGRFNRVSDQNYRIRDALTAIAQAAIGATSPPIIAGNLQIGYALSMYGGSTRTKKNATPNASGQCGNLDGTTQTGWNIKWVDVAAGAGGGSELANRGQLGRVRPTSHPT